MFKIDNFLSLFVRKRLISSIAFGYFLGLTPGEQADTIPAMNQSFAFSFYFSKPLRPQLAEEVDLL